MNKLDSVFVLKPKSIPSAMGLMTSREVAVETPVDEVISIMTPSPSSGITHWKHQQQNHHVRQASVRSRASLPMPEHIELDKRFAKVLVRLINHFIYIQINYRKYYCLSTM